MGALPVLALTMGDPSGVGPEIIAKAWQKPELFEHARPLVFGHPKVMQRAVDLIQAAIEIVEVTSVDQVEQGSSRVMYCLKACSDEAALSQPNQVDARGGHAAYQCLVLAATMAIRGEIAAVVTAPLHKAALHLAGHNYPGHTELLAELCDVDDYAMMLYLAGGEGMLGDAGLGVIHVTLHMALREVFKHLTSEAIAEKIMLSDRTLVAIQGRRPRIAVAALNPHGGESGLFGDEETRVIAPAVANAQELGANVQGPFPTDTLMIKARDGLFDAVVAMYHDQGHIALKLLGMHRAVNITLGLPIIRTSVAHGTAFDLAWKGIADERSMLEAVQIAAKLAAAKVS